MMKAFCLAYVMLFFTNSSLPSQPKILIAYYSVEGHTRQMAEAVAQGARTVEGATIRLLPVAQATVDDLLWADAIIIGSPVYNATVAPVVQEFINRWPFEKAPLRDKLGAVFVTGGGISAGEETTQLSIIQSMLIFGMIIIGGPDWTMPFGASAITAEKPFAADSHRVAEQFLTKGEALGRRVSEIARKLYSSRQ
jgi:NAD(P)H dehydrogenase (quinone)